MSEREHCANCKHEICGPMEPDEDDYYCELDGLPNDPFDWCDEWERRDE